MHILHLIYIEKDHCSNDIQMASLDATIHVYYTFPLKGQGVESISCPIEKLRLQGAQILGKTHTLSVPDQRGGISMLPTPRNLAAN